MALRDAVTPKFDWITILASLKTHACNVSTMPSMLLAMEILVKGALCIIHTDLVGHLWKVIRRTWQSSVYDKNSINMFKLVQTTISIISSSKVLILYTYVQWQYSMYGYIYDNVITSKKFFLL